MQYERVREAVFLDRPNRFLARVELEGQMEEAHVKNTGRCRELLVPGVRVWLDEKEPGQRKTRFDLIAVEKGGRLINLDSQAPNRAVEEWLPDSGLFDSLDLLRREVTYGSSRFDFYLEGDGRRLFMEVKGVTLEEEGVARFPDAPTERGVKHLRELMACLEEGYEAAVFFLIQMKGVRRFEPNKKTHAAFASALGEARDAGVCILVRDSLVTPDSLRVGQAVPLLL